MINKPNKYSLLDPECLQSHLEAFLIPHWSISALGDFIRNEKAFEKTYVFKQYSNQDSLPSIVGKAYHKALMYIFRRIKNKLEINFVQLTDAGHTALLQTGADRYRPHKKKPIEELQNMALTQLNVLLKNFWEERQSYLDNILEILEVEPKLFEYVTINGVDIPLPLKIGPDLIIINKKGELAVFDHKAKHTFTPQEAIDLKYGNQSIANSLAIDQWVLRQADILERFPKAKNGVKEFSYYENKISKNKDGSPQIRQIPINIDASRPLYEALLYESVFKLMDAVQNPDYIYAINPSDNFQDSEEILDFWIKTHLEGLEGFPNLTPTQVRILKKKKELVRRASLASVPKNIIRQFKNPKQFSSITYEDMQDKSNSEKIEYRLRLLNYTVAVRHVIEGYSCDTYLVEIGPGLKYDKIFSYRMDIANALGVPDVRIIKDLVLYKGDSYVAIEANTGRDEKKPLHLESGDILPGRSFPIGKNNFGEIIRWDIDNPSTPYLMIAGAAGSGKSVAIKTIIFVALQKGMEVVILDPKYEFTEYADRCEVLNELEDIEAYMELQVEEVDRIFKAKGAIGNSENKRIIIFDEAADCFAKQKKERRVEVDCGTYANGSPKVKLQKDLDFKTLEQNILIIAQKARSAGIHLVLAAQRFSVQVLTGDAKANFTCRLCLTVASSKDSIVMLDEVGAEKLAGRGDALYSSPEHPDPVRLQCFISE